MTSIRLAVLALIVLTFAPARFVSSALATPPTGVGMASPATVANDGVDTTVLRVVVTPGQGPLSTGLAVTVDAASLTIGPVVLVDNGLPPDAVAGDLIFSARITMPTSAPTGPAILPFLVRDAQGRVSPGEITLTVVSGVGACCLSGIGGGCQQLTPSDCQSLGGVYLGNGVACFSPAGYSVLTQPQNFENIAPTGLLLNPQFIPDRDDGSTTIPIGFPFAFYSGSFNTVNVSTNGFVNFGGPIASPINDPVLPTAAQPNGAIYAYWTDLDVSFQGTIHAQLRGQPGANLRLIIQWTAVPRFEGNDSNTFQIVLFEGGAIECRYASIVAPVGTGVTVGIENPAGSQALQVPGPSLGAGARTLRFVPFPEHNACPNGPTPLCTPRGEVLFDQIDPGAQTGQTISQSTDCQGCLLADASFACDDDFEINGTQGISLPTLLGRVEALVRNTGPLPPIRWRVNIYPTAQDAANVPTGTLYFEEFAGPSCGRPFYSDQRYPGFDLVAFDLGTGLGFTGTRNLLPGTYWISVVAVTDGPAADVLVALSNVNAGPVEPNAFQARYFPPPFQPTQLNQNGAYRLRSAPPCGADFNSDGNLDPDDLSDYIGCYFSQCTRADYNGDGVSDPDDLSDYIGDYFAGCR